MSLSENEKAFPKDLQATIVSFRIENDKNKINDNSNF